MALRIEDYALIGDFYTAALVGRDGSIDWLCLPRFDSGACFCALLGKPEHGRWLLEPAVPVRRVTRQYRDSTLVLETNFETDDGAVTVVDCMPPRVREPAVVRMVVGQRGCVPMHMQLVLRPDYGATIPWVRSTPRGLRAVAGPDTFLLDTQVELRGEGLTTVAEFDVTAGDQVPFVLSWQSSIEPDAEPFDAAQTIRETDEWWREWSSRCTYEGRWREAVVRSLVTLKALTYAPTGGIVAAVTTSLPEKIGGVRNWDYRYCWVRDASFTLFALLRNGYTEEAIAWREWLLRAVAGDAAQMNIMYGLAGERRLTETELDWLPGYENSKPVRIGNAAHRQFQLDVFGEVMAALHLATREGLKPEDDAWHVQLELLNFLEQGGWRKPDEGIWEVRGPRRHFTHSKVMAWVAFDRAIKTAEVLQLEAPLKRWKALRGQIHDEVCRQGFDPQRNTFVQYYGGQPLDASLLMIPLVGFLPGDDPRVRGTVEAIERELMTDGFVRRYPTTEDVDGLPPGEGAFLACTFWLVDNYHSLGRTEEAERLMERLLDLRNDVGLLAEEYDPHAGRLVGNFPQAFSHVGLVNAARRLLAAPGSTGSV
ncbi:MAG TPA: glycoside hydrolase family 15 protein [Pirellulales bacterium]|jgi:GH15 family glucan-1,4-alpha-glucosidase|nr:glycoside hydrolase family 15 protein [Pirellulales bacterium]